MEEVRGRGSQVQVLLELANASVMRRNIVSTNRQDPEVMSLSPQTRRIRVRVAEQAKRGRKQWDLYRYLWDPHVLHDALRLVMKNGGRGGLDGQSLSDLKGQEWEFSLRLSEKLKAGTYKPGVVLRVHIPKKDGRKRPLGIPNVEDRVLQRALVLLLETIYEQRFHDFSYGFRPHRRAVDCVAAVAKKVYSHRYVLEADIENFFGQVNHNKLLGFLSKEIADPRVMRMISKILKTGFQEPGKPWQPSTKGTPQGGPLSPLLANVYLHHVLNERYVEVYGHNHPRVSLYVYADDFVFVCTTRRDAETVRSLLNAWLHEGGLSLKAEKTRLVDMSNARRGHSSKFDFLGYKIHLRAFRDNPKRFWVSRQASESSRRSLKASFHEKLHPHLSINEARQMTSRIWRGWCNYFRYANGNRVFYREKHSVRKYVIRYLRRKFRRQRCPVAWRKLIPLMKQIMEPIRPPRVLPNHLSQGQLILI